MAKNKNQKYKEKFKSINTVKKEIVTGVFSQANSADSWDFGPFLSKLVKVFDVQSDYQNIRMFLGLNGKSAIDFIGQLFHHSFVPFFLVSWVVQSIWSALDQDVHARYIYYSPMNEVIMPIAAHTEETISQGVVLWTVTHIKVMLKPNISDSIRVK